MLFLDNYTLTETVVKRSFTKKVVSCLTAQQKYILLSFKTQVKMLLTNLLTLSLSD